MGTRGLFGFFYKGKYYVIYNHWDSYPSGLGADVVKELKNAIKDGGLERWIELLIQIKVVDESIPPTVEDIKKLAAYTNLKVSRQSTADWYCLLRDCQGSINEVLSSGYLLNHVDEKGIPCWEEYAYIVNFDTNKLDFRGYDEDEDEDVCRSYDFTALPDW